MIRPDLLPHYTVGDYRRWRDDWELVSGIPYSMAPSPTASHQRIALKIARHLDEELEACPDCQVLQETDWIVAEDTVVRPDVMVICGGIKGDYPTQAPVLIFEILSPSTAHKDEHLKFDLYQREGVNFYGLTYPERKTVKIFRWHEGRLIKMKDALMDRITFPLHDRCRIEFDFSRIWER